MYNYTYFFLVIYHFMHIYFISYSLGGKNTHLFPSLPHFLIIPEGKQYLELQIGGKLV